MYDVFIYTHTNPMGQRGYLLDYDSRPSEAMPLLNLIKRYILRSKVKARDASEEYDVWASWGSRSEQTWDTVRSWTKAPSGVLEPIFGDELNWPWGTQDEAIQDRRAVGMGRRLLVRKGDRREHSALHLSLTLGHESE